MIRLKTIFAFFLLSFCAAFMTACQNDPGVLAKVDAARARNDGPPIWRVTRGDSTLYIYGAVHRLPYNFDWQREDFNKVFATTGTVFFEVSQDTASLERAQVIAARDGYYSGYKKLTDHLSEYEQKLLLAATLNVDLPPGALHNMQPWMAANTLVNTELTQAGQLIENGADAIIHTRAKQAGKHILYLETMDAHLTGTATLPLPIQLEGLRSTMLGAGDLAQQTERLNLEWARGNAVYISDNIITPLERSAPEYYQALFASRNKNWAKSLSAFLKKENTSGLVVVGVGHMIGPDNLLDMLELDGNKVERYYGYRGENVIRTIDLDVSGGVGEL